jgi:hypothetical protein
MKEMDFAHGVLFEGQKNEVEGWNTRDSIFKSILASFECNPVSVFQVGAIETFRFSWRIGSGWSDMIWGEYVAQHGGRITVADISIDNLANSTLAAVKLGYEDKLQTFHGNAINYIEEGYDIYYLDGSDDPFEMLNQFNKIKHTSSIVIMDDYRVKGGMVEVQRATEGFAITVHTIGNHVAVIDLRGKPQ